jgi:putative peptidoglycan binding protein
MKRLSLVACLLAMLNVVSAAPVRPTPFKNKSTSVRAKGPHRPASRGEAIDHKKAGKGGKVNVRRVTVRRMVHGRMVTVSRVVRVKAGPVIPPHPDTDRLREIQQAMADKGYFKGEVNGVWNPDSVDALKRFQTERNITPDGKINSLSLIGLGLGPKHDGAVAALPLPSPQQNIPQ